MTTTVIKIKGTTAPAGLPVINVSADEYSIVGMPSLLEWFRADVGITGTTLADFRWAGRKNGYQLRSSYGAPTLSATPQNGKPILEIGGLQGIYDADNRGLWPSNADYTVAIVARAVAGDNGVAFGNQAGSDYGFLQFSSNGDIYVKHQASGSFEVSSSYAASRGTNLVMIVLSYEYALKKLTMTINRVDTKVKTGGVLDTTNGQLRLGAAGTPGTVNYGTLDAGGGVAELLTFNAALHKSAYATKLSMLQNYLATRYAIA